MLLIGMIYLFHSVTVRNAAPAGYLVAVIVIRTALHFKDGIKSNVTFLLVSGIFFVALYLLTDRATIPQNRIGGTVTGIICGILTVGAFEITSGILPLCVPVISVNIISGIIEYLTSDASERHAIVKEEA
jgi:Na+-translocating ferredoxin:NAD+ oxidoreductase RnfD subunit